MAYATVIDPRLGEVRISFRRGTSRVSARWDKGRAHLIVPAGLDIKEAMEYLERARPYFEQSRKPPMFAIGRDIPIDRGPVIRIVADAGARATVNARMARDGGAVIGIGLDFDMGDPQADGIISRMLIRVAVRLAPGIILPELDAEVSRLGLIPRSTGISRGHKVLGHCNARGDIAISAICLFLPYELRRYIYCHELAHLTEMNHSPRFHALCDRYLSGHEAELSRKVDRYAWPLLR